MLVQEGTVEQVSVPKWILELIERYQFQRTVYLKDQKKEYELRKEFVDPFFKTLGWDVDNDKGNSDRLKDVIHEDPITIHGQTKSIDYSFRVGGHREFIVETKKPSINLFENSRAANDAALQLRRYAWNAGLKIGILTNFEQFAVYDCTIRPLANDTFSKARIIDYTYLDYPEKWTEIFNIFAKKSVYNGSFDRFVDSRKGKHGTATVNEEFLKDIEDWRKEIAQNIAIRNKDLTKNEVNLSVQKIIDRIIFLRICEDRGIEKYETLKQCIEGSNVYQKICELFKKADDRYNSGLFHFNNDDVLAELADTLTPNLKIDDKILKDIIKRLYFPDSPYEFSVIPPVILGEVYEQFLGKVIRLTEGHQVRIEPKEGVKKAGGVYYTPQYIVEYIVKRTLGELVKGKSPRDVAKLHILDPACGSGSFLIGAYQYLLDWHLEWYLANLIPIYNEKKSLLDPSVKSLLPEPATRLKRKKSDDPIELPLYNTGYSKNTPLLERRRSTWKLTTVEKKRILINNIFGVDIDQQAVEVTKLSLLLKVLEDENDENISKQLKLFAERALPSLNQNIKCGNSLINTEIYTDPQISLDESEATLINAFDWNSEFSDIMKMGGFDAVIGNPPYLNIDDTWGKNDKRLGAIKKQYPEIYNDKTDILFYFLAKGVCLSKGFVSFIVSRAFLEAFKANKLRKYLSSNSAINEIIDFQNFYVFEGVGITTCIVTLEPRKRPSITVDFKLMQKVLPSLELERYLNLDKIFERVEKAQKELNAAPWIFASDVVEKINKKIDDNGKIIGDILAIGKGMETGRNDVFGKCSDDEIKSWGLNKGQYFKRAANSDIQRYSINDRKEFLLYLEEIPKFKNLPDGVQTYLNSHISELKERAAFKRGDCEWWKYTWPLHKEWYDRPRLLCPYLAMFNRFALDTNKEYLGLTDTTILFENGQPEDLKYILGLLNSQLLSFRFQSIAKLKSGGIREYFWNSVSKLPIRTINFSDPTDKARHDRMVMLVIQMMDLNKKLQDAKLEQDKIQITRQITAIDAAIEKLVYELYGLTDEEISIVKNHSMD